MRYLMLIYGNEQTWTSLAPDELTRLIAEVDAFNAALRESREFAGAEGLEMPATSFRRGDGDGEVIVTDGPYLEAKEFVGSYFMVDVADAARAREIARSYPGIRYGGGVEMWPLMRDGGAPLDG